jgi:hypothetical protein
MMYRYTQTGILQYIESIQILYVQLGQTVDCCTHVHIAAKFE